MPLNNEQNASIAVHAGRGPVRSPKAPGVYGHEAQVALMPT